MSRKFFTNAIAAFLTIIILAPSAFFIAPQKAQAQWMTIDLPVGISTALTQIEATLTQLNTYTSMVALYADYINTYVLQPLAFVLSGNLMKALTASVVKFVSGQSNGTGAPQFTTNLAKTMQTLSDMKAKAYLSQVNLTGSPFASSISAALSKNYLQGSSLGGFWAANTCTLSKSSPNVSAYLAGNWSQGGVSAWFALTTQSQNNPYMLYQNSQAQLGSVVMSATQARLAEINWGSGFMSWCSVSDTTTQTQAGASTAMDACAANGGTPAYCDKVFANAGGVVGGINPGDACTNKDGTQGTIQTPGSTIKATLDKVLGGQQDKLVQMGNISSQITGILGNIATVINTVNLASNILGGTGMGGLLNAGQPSGALTGFTPTRDASGNFTSGYGGVTSETIAQSVNESPVSAGFSSNLVGRVNLYQTAWTTIGTAANTAKTSIDSLINTCTTNVDAAKVLLTTVDPDTKLALQSFIDAATLQASAAQTALTTEVLPVTTQAAGVPQIVSAVLAMNTKVQNEVGTATYTADMKTLLAMPPTSADISAAQKDSKVFDTAVANPVGSLTIVPSTAAKFVSLVDQMALISTNAAALETTVCSYPALGGGGGGGEM